MLSNALNLVFPILAITFPLIWLGRNWLNNRRRYDQFGRLEVLAAIKFAIKSVNPSLELGRMLELLPPSRGNGSIKQLSDEIGRYLYAPPRDNSWMSVGELINRSLSRMDKILYWLVWAQPLGEKRHSDKSRKHQAWVYGVSMILCFGAMWVSRNWLVCQKLEYLVSLSQNEVLPNVPRLLQIARIMEFIQEIATAVLLVLAATSFLIGWLGPRIIKSASWGLVLALLHLCLTFTWSAPRFFDPLIVVQSIDNEGRPAVGTRGVTLPVWDTLGRQLVWVRNRDNTPAAMLWVRKEDYVGLYEYSSQCLADGYLVNIIRDK